MSHVKLSLIVFAIVSCFAIMAFSENEVRNNEMIKRMEKPGKRPNVTPGKPGSGWHYKTKHYKIDGENYQEFWLDVPEISFQYQGQEYSIGGSSVYVIAKWVDDLPFNSEKDGTVFAQYKKSFQKDGYDIQLSNNLESRWKRFLYNDWVSGIDQIPPILPSVRHEVVHLLVDRKYHSLWETQQWGEKTEKVYHFIHEIMAHMGGEGMSKEEALKQLMTVPAYASFREITLDYMADQAGHVLDKLNQHQKSDEAPEREELKSNIQPKHETMSSQEKTSKSEIGVRGWCHCPNRSAHIVRGNLVRMGEDFSVADYSYFFCTDCYKIRKNLDNVVFLIHDGPICIWDVEIARENGYKRGTINLDDNTKKLLMVAQEKLMQIPEDEVVIPGLCHCSMPTCWIFEKGTAREIEMCKKCGKPLAAIPYNVTNNKTTRKLRRCTKGSNVCRCKEETGLYPQCYEGLGVDGLLTFALCCNKCGGMKYSVSIPKRELINKFADRKPTPKELYKFIIGTDDLNAAMRAADQEAK